ncbi:hypothetical protein PR048_027123, partial [Dryococelus australis]
MDSNVAGCMDTENIGAGDSPGAAVAERLDCSALTKMNRAQSPAGSLPDFRKWESCRTMPLVGAGFLGDLPFSLPLHSGAAPYSPHFTLVDSQDLAVESHPSPEARDAIRGTLTRVPNTPSRSGGEVRLLASHLGESGSIPGRWGRTRITACGNRDEPWSAGFLGDVLFSSALHSGTVPHTPHSTLVDSQGHNAKSRPNLFTSLHLACVAVLIGSKTTSTCVPKKLRGAFRVLPDEYCCIFESLGRQGSIDRERIIPGVMGRCVGAARDSAAACTSACGLETNLHYGQGHTNFAKRTPHVLDFNTLRAYQRFPFAYWRRVSVRRHSLGRMSDSSFVGSALYPSPLDKPAADDVAGCDVTTNRPINATEVCEMFRPQKVFLFIVNSRWSSDILLRLISLDREQPSSLKTSPSETRHNHDHDHTAARRQGSGHSLRWFERRSRSHVVCQTDVTRVYVGCRCSCAWGQVLFRERAGAREVSARVSASLDIVRNDGREMNRSSFMMSHFTLPCVNPPPPPPPPTTQPTSPATPPLQHSETPFPPPLLSNHFQLGNPFPLVAGWSTIVTVMWPRRETIADCNMRSEYLALTERQAVSSSVVRRRPERRSQELTMPFAVNPPQFNSHGTQQGRDSWAVPDDERQRRQRLAPGAIISARDATGASLSTQHNLPGNSFQCGRRSGWHCYRKLTIYGVQLVCHRSWNRIPLKPACSPVCKHARALCPAQAHFRSAIDCVPAYDAMGPGFASRISNSCSLLFSVRVVTESPHVVNCHTMARIKVVSRAFISHSTCYFSLDVCRIDSQHRISEFFEFEFRAHLCMTE